MLKEQKVKKAKEKIEAQRKNEKKKSEQAKVEKAKTQEEKIQRQNEEAQEKYNELVAAADKEDLSTGPDFGEPRAPLGASGQGSAAFHTLLAHSQQQAAARTERFSRADAAKPAAADVIGEILSRSRASGRHA